jgi:hypothetical protein
MSGALPWGAMEKQMEGKERGLTHSLQQHCFEASLTSDTSASASIKEAKCSSL